MAPFAFPFKDPGHYITAPNNPRGRAAAIALNRLWRSVNLNPNSPGPITLGDITHAFTRYLDNHLLAGLQRKENGPFYHIWHDNSMIVGHTDNGRTTLLPVALSISKKLHAKIGIIPKRGYTDIPFDTIQYTNTSHIDGLDFWLSMLNDTPPVSMTPNSPTIAAWATMLWREDDATTVATTLAKEAASWYMVHSGHWPKTCLPTLYWTSLNRNGTFTPTTLAFAYSADKNADASYDHAQIAIKGVQDYLATHPQTKGNQLLEQSASKGKTQQPHLRLMLESSQTSAHDHIARAERFASKIGL